MNGKIKRCARTGFLYVEKVQKPIPFLTENSSSEIPPLLNL